MIGEASVALDGCTVVVTRERAGELGRLLASAGADVVHIPLIEVVDVEADGGLSDALDDGPDWVVVTSAAGSERVARHLSDSATVQLAAVGTVTAQRLEELTDRRVDLVPSRQVAAELLAAFVHANPTPQDVVIAQADRARSDLADGLRAHGHSVNVVTAYRTEVRRPTDTELQMIEGADVVTFASGSAATGWVEAFGERSFSALPSIVVAIGPSTAEAAIKSGLKVTHVAADHSLVGLLDEVTNAWIQRQRE